MHRLIGYCIAALILIGASKAQGLQPFPFTYQGRTPWPGSLPNPGTFKRQIAADFTGDGLKDVFVLAGGAPLFFYAPDSWEVVYPASNSGDPAYNDMAFISRVGDGLPQIALVGASGLERLIYYPPTDPPVPPGNGTLVAGSFARFVIAGGSTWTNAKIVRTGNVDSGPELDFVGLKSDAHTVIVRRVTSAGVVQSVFSVPETVYDIALLQWNETPDLEIALLDGYGVDVFSWSGSLIHRFTRPASGSETFCIYRENILDGGVQVADGRDRIAWARQKGGVPAAQEIVELYGPSESVVSSVLMNDPDDPIVSMSGADLATDAAPADGNWELVVHHKANCAPFIFKNLGPSMTLPAPPSFSNQGVPDATNSTWENLDLASLQSQSASRAPGSNTMAAPLCADLNGDGKVDVHVAVQAGVASFFQCWRGGIELMDDDGEAAAGGAFVTAVRHLGASVPSGPGASFGLEFAFDLDVLPWPSNANALEWTIWSRDVVSGNYSAYQHVYYTIPPGPLPTGVIYPVAPIEIPPDITCSSEQFWYEIRFASTTTGNLLACSTDYIDAVGSNPEVLLLLKNLDYSTETCVTGTLGCSQFSSICPVPEDGRHVTGPLSMTRRRMVAPSGSGTGYLPLPPEAHHLGDVPTQSHP